VSAGSSTAAGRSAAATAAAGGSAGGAGPANSTTATATSGALEILAARYATTPHLLGAVDLRYRPVVVGYRPPLVVWLALLPLVRGLVTLEDVALPVGEYVTTTGPGSLSRSSAPVIELSAGAAALYRGAGSSAAIVELSAGATGTVDAGSSEVTVVKGPVVAGDDTAAVAVNIRTIVVDKCIPVTGKIISIETIGAITVPGISRPVGMRSPPSAAAPSASAPVAAAETAAEMEPSEAEAITKAPSAPGVVAEAKSPGPGPRIIETVEPGVIIKTGTIDHCRSVDKTIQVARSIAHIDILRGYVIDVYIFGIIKR